MNNNEIILITGGTGLIGSALVKHFALAGHHVYFTSRDANKISEIENTFSAHIVKGIQVDHLAADALSHIMDEFARHQQQPTVLINNVRNIDFISTLKPNGLPHESDWMGELKLAVMVPTELTMALATHPQSALKSVINISSIYGINPPNLNLYHTKEEIVPIHYGVAKAAQLHLTKELAVRLASSNIRVNAVSYGGIQGRANDDFAARYARLCPQQKMLTTNDIAGPVEFLMSSTSASMTGHNLVVDGGWTIW